MNILNINGNQSSSYHIDRVCYWKNDSNLDLIGDIKRWVVSSIARDVYFYFKEKIVNTQ